jgi:transposase
MAKVRGLPFPLLMDDTKVYIMHAYYWDNHSLRETACEFGVSKSGLHGAFQRLNLPCRTKQHAKFINNPCADIARLMNVDWRAGMSIPMIAKKHNYSTSGVNHLLNAYGYKRQAREARYYEIAS